jgi:hypothetical protein
MKKITLVTGLARLILQHFVILIILSLLQKHLKRLLHQEVVGQIFKKLEPLTGHMQQVLLEELY